jgi:hypothetical protein
VVVDASRIAAFPIFADLPAAELDEHADAAPLARRQDFDRI